MDIKRAWKVLQGSILKFLLPYRGYNRSELRVTNWNDIKRIDNYICSITIEIGELPKYPKINSTSGRLTDQIKLNDIEEFEYRVVRINNVLYNSKIASNYSRIDGKVSQNQLVLPIKSKG